MVKNPEDLQSSYLFSLKLILDFCQNYHTYKVGKASSSNKISTNSIAGI